LRVLTSARTATFTRCLFSGSGFLLHAVHRLRFAAHQHAQTRGDAVLPTGRVCFSCVLATVYARSLFARRAGSTFAHTYATLHVLRSVSTHVHLVPFHTTHTFHLFAPHLARPFLWVVTSFGWLLPAGLFYHTTRLVLSFFALAVLYVWIRYLVCGFHSFWGSSLVVDSSRYAH